MEDFERIAQGVDRPVEKIWVTVTPVDPAEPDGLAKFKSVQAQLLKTPGSVFWPDPAEGPPDAESGWSDPLGDIRRYSEALRANEHQRRQRPVLVTFDGVDVTGWSIEEIYERFYLDARGSWMEDRQVMQSHEGIRATIGWLDEFMRHEVPEGEPLVCAREYEDYDDNSYLFEQDYYLNADGRTVLEEYEDPNMLELESHYNCARCGLRIPTNDLMFVKEPGYIRTDADYIGQYWASDKGKAYHPECLDKDFNPLPKELTTR